MGITLADDTSPKDWDEVGTLIRDLSQFTEGDIKALDVLVSVYARFVSVNERTPILATAFQDSIDEQVKAYRAAGFAWDEFYSRCARLVGFGLAIQVRMSQRPSLQHDSEYIFRPTQRGKRLCQALHRSKPRATAPPWALRQDPKIRK
jgi:hypothetical protein